MINIVVGSVLFMIGIIALIPIALLGIRMVGFLAFVLAGSLKNLSEFLIAVDGSLWRWLRLPTADDGLSFYLLLFFSIAGGQCLIIGGLTFLRRLRNEKKP
jgi:hypothetical protein